MTDKLEMADSKTSRLQTELQEMIDYVDMLEKQVESQNKEIEDLRHNKRGSHEGKTQSQAIMSTKYQGQLELEIVDEEEDLEDY